MDILVNNAGIYPVGPTHETGRMGEGFEQLAAQAPARRPATADEIAEAIVFLATDRASFVDWGNTAGGWREHCRSDRITSSTTTTSWFAIPE